MAIITGTSLADLLNGTASADTIAGLGGDDTLTGAGGNDRLNGGAGADRMIGSTGNDLYFVNAPGDTVVEKLNQGTDTVRSSITYKLTNHVEKLILTGSGAIDGTGNTLDNVLTGNAGNNSLAGAGGNDTLNGGADADRMIGGTGNDLYFVDAPGDTVVEKLNQGTDTVRSSITYKLTNHVEKLILTGAGANTLTLALGDVLLCRIRRTLSSRSGTRTIR